MIKYKIYPSLLDNFEYYLRNDSEDDIQKLLDSINRVPFTSDAADKGTAFNELVDEIIKAGSVPNYETALDVKNALIDDGLPEFRERQPKDYSPDKYFDHSGFFFKKEIVSEFANKLMGAIPQYRTGATINTKFGEVLIYGVIDEILPGRVIDIKTTSRYTFPKYTHGWQSKIYPYCLAKEGIIVDEFEYMVTNFRDTFSETYSFNFEKAEKQIRVGLEHFIKFIEDRRHLITDKKIFALDELEPAL